MLEVVGLPHVHAHERHQLKLRQALSGGRREWKQVPQVRDLRVYQVTAQFARSLCRLASVEPTTSKISCYFNTHKYNRNLQYIWFSEKLSKVMKYLHLKNINYGTYFSKDVPFSATYTK